MHRYIATAHGTLSDPYRFVAKDERIESDEELDVEWLVPLHDYVEPKTLPLMPNMAPKPQAVRNFEIPIEPNYQRQMDQVIANEKTIDGATKPIEPQGNGKKAGGTGNQSVL